MDPRGPAPHNDCATSLPDGMDPQCAQGLRETGETRAGPAWSRVSHGLAATQTISLESAKPTQAQVEHCSAKTRLCGCLVECSSTVKQFQSPSFSSRVNPRHTKSCVIHERRNVEWLRTSKTGSTGNSSLTSSSGSASHKWAISLSDGLAKSCVEPWPAPRK